MFFLQIHNTSVAIKDKFYAFGQAIGGKKGKIIFAVNFNGLRISLEK